MRRRLTQLLAAAVVAAGLVMPAATPAAGAPSGAQVPNTSQAAWSLIGGRPLTSLNNVRCTLGFNARNDMFRFVVTSGQCASTGSSWSGVGGPIGPTHAWRFPSRDFGLVRVTSTEAASSALIDRYTIGPDVTVTGHETPGVGATVCYSSAYVLWGWACGRVIATQQTKCYIPGCVHGLLRTTLCYEPGAAGASVVTDPGSGTTVRAVGIVTDRADASDCETGGTTLVQPIAPMLAAYGITLVTGTG